jgi:sugar phosphate isomerase/epimerase
MAELKSALADAGLAVVSMIALPNWINSEGEEKDRAFDECRRRMDQAAELGSPSIVASPPREPVDMARASARFVELCALGKRAGIRPSMEFLVFVAGIKSLDSAWAIASAPGADGAPIVADVFHMIRGGGSVDDLLMLEGRKLANFHVNDVPATPDPLTQTDSDRVMPGEGIADLPRVFVNLRSIGYEGPVSLELFNPSLWDADPVDVARQGLDRVRRFAEG